MNNKRGGPPPPLTDRERAYFGPRTEKTPGSVAWCWQTILLMQARWEQKRLDEAGFEALVQDLSAHEAWKVVPPEQPYGSLDALLQAEIGHTAQAAREVLQAQAHPKEGRPKKLANLASFSQGGRAQQNGISLASQKKLDYLAGNRPDLLHEVQQGALSIHAAYQRAKGKPPETPFEVLRRTWRRASRDEQVRFVREMLTDDDALRQAWQHARDDA